MQLFLFFDKTEKTQTRIKDFQRQSIIAAAIKAIYSRDNMYKVVFYIFYKPAVLLEAMVFLIFDL